MHHHSYERRKQIEQETHLLVGDTQLCLTHNTQLSSYSWLPRCGWRRTFSGVSLPHTFPERPALSTQTNLRFDYVGLVWMHPSVLRISTVNRRRQIPSCQTVGCLQPYLGFCDASCSVTAAARLPAQKLLQRGEPKKEAGVIRQGWDTFLSHPLSPRSTCSVSRWDQEGGAVEGKGRVRRRHARSGKGGRWGRRSEMERRSAVHRRYQPMP